jgi:Uncharacterized conserved protein
MKLEQTADGSYTLYVPELDEHYHSVKGALTESQHIFIEMGLKHSPVSEPHILEIGLGTGLNAFLTLLSAEETRRKVHYTGIERYPLAEETLKQLDYPRLIGKQHEEDYYAIHQGTLGTQKQRYPLGSHYIKLKMILPGFSTRRKAAVPPFPYTISSTLMPSLPKNNPKCGNNLFSILYTRY